ncbi:EamA family transporter [Endozoicomonas sp. OPT23]|uniref:DMT family transporter n=1 Tax=Endozoicomonas sp. OPT23 TaxID=2072845 RepID=UPI00129BCA7B|nr:DMT family transporter [Endozoicomonas sp. OPT23]MRI33833.1 EamA family transporter [Endozoicomonas sp. OPT23]
MNPSSLLQLFALAAIWGGSFLFMRIAATVLSPAVMIEVRVGLAALFLSVVAFALKKKLPLLQHWKHFLIIGLFNSALPFLLFAWSAQTLTASMLSILNATSPIWGTLIGVVARQNSLTVKTVIGLLSGILGVALLVGLDGVVFQDKAEWAIIAALGAAFSYGIASTYARTAASVPAFDNAHGSMWAATLLIMPLLIFSPVNDIPGTDVITSVLLLGVVCTGMAYLIYFKLIADIGAPSALTVTFLVPVFGVAWGALILDEAIGWHMVAGTLMVIVGTALVTGFSISSLFKRKGKVNA